MSDEENHVRFQILGPVRVYVGRDEVPITERERAMLATLLCHANDVVGVDRLIDAIWGDRLPRGARNQVQSCVSRVRKRLAAAGFHEQIIMTEPAGYQIRATAERLDLRWFREQVADARAAATQARPHDAIAGYRKALSLWRGSALAGIDSDLLRRTSLALDEEHLRAVEEHIDLELAVGGAGELVAELTDLVAQHPYRERLHGALMLALYRAGRQADALATYQRARQVLVDDVGTEPGPALRDLHQRILNEDRTLVAEVLDRAEKSRPTAIHCLPRGVDDFTGRPQAVARLIDAANASPGTSVLAIDGMAGVGKTTLAVHVAHMLVDRYPDAQLFIDLHGHSEHAPVEPAAALGTLLRQFGVPSGRIPVELEDRAALWRHELAERRALVVLDNAASANQVIPLLPAGLGCLALVTSRRRLTGLPAARPLSLDVLAIDEAVVLLEQIAGDRVRREPAAATEVASLCGHLPLAIRLAGARLAHRPNWRVRDLADRLRSASGGPLTELTAEDRTVARALALSYQHLKPDIRWYFRLLGLHPGEEFDAVALAALADITLDESERALEDLVDQHLVGELRPGRYRLHDLVREYAHRLASTVDSEARRRLAVAGMLDFYLHATAATSVGFERSVSRRRFISAHLSGQTCSPDRSIAEGPGWTRSGQTWWLR